VGFRYTAEERALGLGLCGWVANRGDGSLELLAEGPNDRLLDFIAWLHEGPPAARVDSVRARPVTPSGLFRTFSVEF
jgi:acylphosphatase